MATLKVELEGVDQEITFDDEYSFKNHAGGNLAEADLNGKTIYASTFASEQPGTQVFHPEIIGVTFIKCNLDNVVIPDGNTLIECSTKRFKAQDDGYDWIVDENNVPVERIG